MTDGGERRLDHAVAAQARQSPRRHQRDIRFASGMACVRVGMSDQVDSGIVGETVKDRLDGMEQATFVELEHDSKRRRTRREIFLEKMDRLVPWKRLEKRVEPFYPKAGRGRRPYPLRTMLRVHCVQLFYNLSDPEWRICSTRWCCLSHKSTNGLPVYS